MAVNPTNAETIYALNGATLAPFPTVFPYEFQTDIVAWVDIGTGPRC